MKNTGVILAAGLGTRLRQQSENNNIEKPLIKVDGLILLLHAIYSLEIADCKKIIVVLGFEAEKIRNFIINHYSGQSVLNFVINEKYEKQNGLSVLCAWPRISGTFLLTMADHILDDQIMHSAKKIVPPEDGAVLCVDYKLETIFDMDDATKVFEENNSIKSIGKHLKHYNCIDTGVFICTDGLMKAIDHVYKEKGDASLSEGVQLLADQGLMKVMDIKNAFWQDVDDIHMLAHAEKLLKKRDIVKHGNKRNELL